MGQSDVQEIDVWPEFQNLTGDVISRVAFGSSFSEGRKIFQLQSEQAQNAVKMANVMYIPGYRSAHTFPTMQSHLEHLPISSIGSEQYDHNQYIDDACLNHRT